MARKNKEMYEKAKSKTKSKATKTSVKLYENLKDSILPVLPTRSIVILPSLMVELYVSREVYKRTIKGILENDKKYIITVAQNDSSFDTPGLDNLYKVGCLVYIKEHLELPDGTMKLLVYGEHRVKIVSYFGIDNLSYYDLDDDKDSLEDSYSSYNRDDSSHIPDIETDLVKASAKVKPIFAKYGLLEDKKNDNLTKSLSYKKLLVNKAKELYKSVSFIPDEIVSEILQTESISMLIDKIAFFLLIPVSDKQQILEDLDLENRYNLIVLFVERELENFDVAKNIYKRTREQIEKNQKDYFLHEQIKAIQKELQESEDSPEHAELKTRILKLKATNEVKEKLEEEYKKLERIPSMSPEYSNIINYIEYILSLPWSNKSKLFTDINKIKKILNAEHYGLEKIKNTILEFIAIYIKTKQLNKNILCLIGPPGVGKTSIAASIAKAMNRKYQRIALGGMHDEAEIRGHRRTYIGSMPGKIIQKIKHAKTKNPMILLDEIDKVNSDFRGDPSSALLEVLDPEQNKFFTDNYVELEFDLSEVLFICTANTRNIPNALKDRMEFIDISGYIDTEKVSIAKQFLIPKQLKLSGLSKKDLIFNQGALEIIIHHYTREAGVRELERSINKICRKVVLEFLGQDKTNKTIIDENNIQKYLGIYKYNRDGFDYSSNKVGEVNGLAWTPFGGSILKIQVNILPGGKGDIIKTGSLGTVMQESIQSALSVVRKQLALMGQTNNILGKYDIHIHIPDNATPKDGPSAGISIATAILSSFLQTPIDAKIALTGEISLTGEVLPIGGLKEKLYAAVHNKIKSVIIPKKNEIDLSEVPDQIKDKLSIRMVENIYEVWDVILLKGNLSFNKKTLNMLSGNSKVNYLPLLPVNKR